MLEITPERIKQGRLENGFTQEHLGKILNVTKQSISRWEKGVNLPESPTMNKLADLFGYSVDYLYGRTDNPTPANIILEEQNNNAPLLSPTNNYRKEASALLSELLLDAGLINDSMSEEELYEISKKVVDIFKIVTEGK